jgi:hypothetical protein
VKSSTRTGVRFAGAVWAPTIIGARAKAPDTVAINIRERSVDMGAIPLKIRVPDKI